MARVPNPAHGQKLLQPAALRTCDGEEGRRSCDEGSEEGNEGEDGNEGEEGNEGIIVFEKDILIEIPKKNNEYEEGVYLTYLSLSKVSIQFEFELKDKEEFDAKGKEWEEERKSYRAKSK